MSKITLAPDASGTAVFTVAAPGTSTNRTLTLPDATGILATLADVSSSSGVNIQAFTASGTYTPTAGYTYGIIFATGGGQGGGRNNANATPTARAGSGADTTIGVVSLASGTVTIGAGGAGGTGLVGSAGGNSSLLGIVGAGADNTGASGNYIISGVTTAASDTTPGLTFWGDNTSGSGGYRSGNSTAGGDGYAGNVMIWEFK